MKPATSSRFVIVCQHPLFNFALEPAPPKNPCFNFSQTRSSRLTIFPVAPSHSRRYRPPPAWSDIRSAHRHHRCPFPIHNFPIRESVVRFVPPPNKSPFIFGTLHLFKLEVPEREHFSSVASNRGHLERFTSIVGSKKTKVGARHAQRGDPTLRGSASWRSGHDLRSRNSFSVTACSAASTS